MRGKLTWMILLGTAILFSHAMQGETWHATVGAQSDDKALQALAFLPNEIWIHTGDSIEWMFNANETHSVTFLKVGQLRPSFLAGCPGATLPNGATGEGSTFDGSGCVNSGLRAASQTSIPATFTVTISKAGNYTVICLLHVNQTGTVHVLDPDPKKPLPHDQDFYDRQAAVEQRDLLSDRDGGLTRKFRADAPGQFGEENAHAHNNMVVTGSGEIVSTTGGAQSVSNMRFGRASIRIHTGEFVEWNSSDVSGHSITFGEEPPGGYNALSPPSASASVVMSQDLDGALHAVIMSPSDRVHSGRIAPASQERPGLGQLGPGNTRFRVTFTTAGTYPYVCAFHDDLGMKGEVIVLP